MVTKRRIGRIIELYEDKAVIQVFEGSEGMSLEEYTYQADRTSDGDCACHRICWDGRSTESASRSMDWDRLLSGLKRDVNGLPLNPVTT